MADKTKANKKAVTAEEAAAMYSLNTGTLANYRANKTGPRYIKRGSKILYFLSDIEEWLRAGTVLTADSLPEYRCKCER
jgi:hypothetical protein